MKINKGCYLALASGLLFGGAVQAGDVRSPSMLSNTCAGCHGTNGASAGLSMPSIAGLDKGYLTEVMLQYKSGERPATIMDRIARGYSELELKAIAAFYAEQPWVSAKAKVNSGKAAKGKKIHEEQCETCHEDGGRTQEDDTPRIAGQWPDFTFIQLHDGRDANVMNGRLPMPKKMKKRVKKLSAEEIENLAHYYASQK